MGFVLIAVIAATSFVSSWLTRKEEHQIQSAAAAVREEALQEQKLEKETDKEPPVLTLTTDKIIVYEGDEINYEAFVKRAWDDVQGDVRNNVTSTSIDTAQAGIKIIKYSVHDFGLSYGINSHDYDRLDKSHIIHQLVHTPYKGMRIEVICPIEEDCIDCNNCRINPDIEEAIQKILDVQEEGITSSLQFSF